MSVCFWGEAVEFQIGIPRFKKKKYKMKIVNFYCKMDGNLLWSFYMLMNRRFVQKYSNDIVGDHRIGTLVNLIVNL